VRSTAEQRNSIAARLAAKEALILFPRERAADGTAFFRSSALFSVADHAATGPITVQPVSIAYTRVNGMPIGRRLPAALRLVRSNGDGAAPVAGAGAREDRGRREFHPPTNLGGLRLAQDAGALL
jgi:hypothetical protein